MFDGIKTKGNILPEPDVLDWHEITNRNTGEILPMMYAHWNGFKFINKEGRVSFRGSLHKFANGGLHNYNDFPFAEVQRAIFRLCDFIQVDPVEIRLENVEFGFNLKTQMPPENYVKALIGHKTTPFTGYSPDRHNYNTGVNCKHQNYNFKTYSKSGQYGLHKNILRYEIAVKKMKFFNDNHVNLKTMADLLNPNVIFSLGDVLKNKSSELVMVDPWDVNQIDREEEKDLLYSWTNPQLFQSRFPNSINYLNRPIAELKKDRKKCYAEKKKFLLTVEKHGLNKLHNDLIKCIDNEMMKMFS